VPTIGDLTAPGWLAALSSETGAGVAGGGAAGAGTGTGGRRGGHDPCKLAPHHQPPVGILHFDLAEILLGQQIGELPNQVVSTRIPPEPFSWLMESSLSLLAGHALLCWGPCRAGSLSETDGRVQS
jgi:hypothetical protein